MWHDVPGVVVYIIFLAGFVFLMSVISSPTFSGDANYYSFLAAGIIIFVTLMVYWERIFPAGE